MSVLMILWDNTYEQQHYYSSCLMHTVGFKCACTYNNFSPEIARLANGPMGTYGIIKATAVSYVTLLYI